VNIDWVIPCRYLEVHDNLGTIVGAGIDTYWTTELPTTLSLVCAIRILGMAEEFDEAVKHRTVSRVRGPDGDLVSELVDNEIAIGLESASPDWLTGLIVPSLVQFEVTEEGTYMIEHELDDSSNSLPVHIVHGFPPGVPPPNGG
jgi:hypothetical protein